MPAPNEAYEALLVQMAEAWPELRVPCHRCDGKGVYVCQGGASKTQSWSGCGQCGGFETCALLEHIPEASRGRGWNPFTDFDTIAAAVLQRKWYLTIEQFSRGDQVTIEQPPDNDGIVLVETKDSLRGTHALVQAIVRAQEAQA